MSQTTKVPAPKASEAPLDELTQAICSALPFAPELAERDVALEPSGAVVSSGNVLPFRRRALSEEERTRLIAAIEGQSKL